jgi:hypothetical protein
LSGLSGGGQDPGFVEQGIDRRLGPVMGGLCAKTAVFAAAAGFGVDDAAQGKGGPPPGKLGRQGLSHEFGQGQGLEFGEVWGLTKHGFHDDCLKKIGHETHERTRNLLNVFVLFRGIIGTTADN